MTDTNLIFYLTAFVISFILTAVAERRLIPALRLSAAQPIYEEGPSWHLSKSGTPTMGGIGFLIAIAASMLLSSLYLYVIGEYLFSSSLLLILLYALLNALIGLSDDYAKIKRKTNAGLTPMQKLILQTAAASLFLLMRSIFLSSSTSIVFSFGSFDIGLLYYPLALFMLVGTVNSANLTDGVDGIASGVAFAIGIVLAFISANADFSVCFTSFILMGAAASFLMFNLHPAKIFMGDTGSLLFGALSAACCCTLGNPLLILFIGGVYLIESLSVIVQVLVFKITKKRIFRMAPIHHHFEKLGWSENKIVIWSIILTLALSLPAIFLFV